MYREREIDRCIYTCIYIYICNYVQLCNEICCVLNHCRKEIVASLPLALRKPSMAFPCHL